MLCCATFQILSHRYSLVPSRSAIEMHITFITFELTTLRVNGRWTFRIQNFGTNFDISFRNAMCFVVHQPNYSVTAILLSQVYQQQKFTSLEHLTPSEDKVEMGQMLKSDKILSVFTWSIKFCSRQPFSVRNSYGFSLPLILTPILSLTLQLWIIQGLLYDGLEGFCIFFQN